VDYGQNGRNSYYFTAINTWLPYTEFKHMIQYQHKSNPAKERVRTLPSPAVITEAQFHQLAHQLHHAQIEMAHQSRKINRLQEEVSELRGRINKGR
jgi:hypothetical protein